MHLGAAKREAAKQCSEAENDLDLILEAAAAER
jgi:hypothetical protein